MRQADGDDLMAVLEVGRITWRATYEPIAGSDYVQMCLAKWWTEESTIPMIRAGRTFVACVDDTVMGMAAAGPHDGDLALWRLYVLPDAQGKGLGGRLLDVVIARALEHGHQRVVLSYLDGNDRARDFYLSRGFVETGREHSGEGIPDSIWLAKDLSTQSQPTDAPGTPDQSTDDKDTQ